MQVQRRRPRQQWRQLVDRGQDDRNRIWESTLDPWAKRSLSTIKTASGREWSMVFRSLAVLVNTLLTKAIYSRCSSRSSCTHEHAARRNTTCGIPGPLPSLATLPRGQGGVPGPRRVYNQNETRDGRIPGCQGCLAIAMANDRSIAHNNERSKRVGSATRKRQRRRSWNRTSRTNPRDGKAMRRQVPDVVMGQQQ